MLVNLHTHVEVIGKYVTIHPIGDGEFPQVKNMIIVQDKQTDREIRFGTATKAKGRLVSPHSR